MMRFLDIVMRLLAGIGGAFLTAGGIYMFTVASKTSGIGLAGTLFGSIAILSLGIGLLLLYFAVFPEGKK